MSLVLFAHVNAKCTYYPLFSMGFYLVRKEQDSLPHSVRLFCQHFDDSFEESSSPRINHALVRVPSIISSVAGTCSKEIDSSSLYNVLRSKVNIETVVLVDVKSTRGLTSLDFLPRSRFPHVTFN